jgi:hypothetical protein
VRLTFWRAACTGPEVAHRALCARSWLIVGSARDSGRLIDVRDVEVEFAVHRDGASIAYEVFGSGPIDPAEALHDA